MFSEPFPGRSAGTMRERSESDLRLTVDVLVGSVLVGVAGILIVAFSWCCCREQRTETIAARGVRGSKTKVRSRCNAGFSRVATSDVFRDDFDDLLAAAEKNTREAFDDATLPPNALRLTKQGRARGTCTAGCASGNADIGLTFAPKGIKTPANAHAGGSDGAHESSGESSTESSDEHAATRHRSKAKPEYDQSWEKVHSGLNAAWKQARNARPGAGERRPKLAMSATTTSATSNSACTFGGEREAQEPAAACSFGGRARK